MMDHGDHGHGWAGRLADRFRHLVGHEHDHDSGGLVDAGAEGIRATQVSLFGLGLTALAQAVLVVVTGSVALLSDTLHNVTDALTAVPLWIAFSLGRRAATRRFTLGYYRVEDLVGVIIVAAIALSAVGILWESVRRLADPRDLDNVWLVVAAGLIGAAGNELVARYRIVVGRRIGSEALAADGQHARTDALTSLAVVAAGLGALAGWRWADPVAGIAVGVMILVLLRRSGARIFGRLLDAVEPEVVDRIEGVAGAVDGVEHLADVTARWQGHRLLVTLTAAVDPALTVGEGHEIAQHVSHALLHEFPFVVEAVVHIDPAGRDDAHSITDHHRQG
jgi:cation diffusion facilitator family transporter